MQIGFLYLLYVPVIINYFLFVIGNRRLQIWKWNWKSVKRRLNLVGKRMNSLFFPLAAFLQMCMFYSSFCNGFFLFCCYNSYSICFQLIIFFTFCNCAGWCWMGGLGNIYKFGSLAEWGLRFLAKDSSLWSKFVASIHGRDRFCWHSLGKISWSLQIPWINILWTWPKVEALAMFKLGNGRRIALWLDSILLPNVYKCSTSLHKNVSLWSRSLLNLSFGRKGRFLWCLGVGAILRVFWGEQNNIVFRGLEREPSDVWSLVCFHVRLCASIQRILYYRVDISFT